MMGLQLLVSKKEQKSHDWVSENAQYDEKIIKRPETQMTIKSQFDVTNQNPENSKCPFFSATGCSNIGCRYEIQHSLSDFSMPRDI